MKNTFKALLSTSVILVVAFFTANASPANAQMAQSEAYCDNVGGKPATVIDNNKGRKVAIIVWVKAFSSGWSPEARCGQVSTKFDDNIKSGNFKYIVSGQAPNGLPVLCASANKLIGI